MSLDPRSGLLLHAPVGFTKAEEDLLDELINNARELRQLVHEVWLQAAQKTVNTGHAATVTWYDESGELHTKLLEE